MNEYRVVRADGTRCIPPDTYEFATAAEAAAEAARLNSGDSGLVGIPYHRPYRVQRIVWEDVPEPEPLPALPTEVWATYSPNGDVTLCRLKCLPSPGYRTFRGTVTEWQEVTE